MKTPDQRPRLKPEAMSELREQCELDREIWRVMDLITTEFESDPMSVQCFDLRLVEEAIDMVKRRRALNDPFNPFKPEPGTIKG